MPMGRSKADLISDLIIDANIAMAGYKLTGLGAGSSNNDSVRYKQLVDALALKLALAGGTMSGNIAMGTKKLTGLGAPTAQNDSLRYGQAEIRNAEIKSDAAIVESKLSLNVATSTLNTKITTDIGTHSDLKTGIHGVVFVRKTADEIVNNDAGVQNDDHLLLAVGANDVWLIEVFLICTSASATPDIDHLWAVPSGGAVTSISAWKDQGAVGAGRDITAETSLDVTSALIYPMYRLWYVGGGTAGNLQLQWAQKTATSEDTKMLTNSFIRAIRIA